MTRQFFAGCLTPAGFVDYFHHIMPLENARKRYFLKGSSGSGKSTFIKKVAAAFTGHDIDLFHCSNDISSVDGIAIPALGFSIIDATAPHSHDPAMPAAVDEILDFAQFLDAEKVAKHRDELMELIATKKRLYAQAQKWLATIGVEGVGSVVKSEQLPHTRNRSLFLSAITPDGVKSFADTTLAHYQLRDIPAGATLHGLKTQALANGFNTESCHNPLYPAQLEALILPTEGVVYMSNEKTQTSPALDNAIAAMHQARTLHYKIEEIYIAAMDFSQMEKLVHLVYNGNIKLRGVSP